MTPGSLESYCQALNSGLIKGNKDRLIKMLEIMGPQTTNTAVEILQRVSLKRVSDRQVSSSFTALHKEGKVTILETVMQPNGYKASLYGMVK